MTTTDAPTRIRYVRPALYEKQEAALFTPARYGVVEASTKSGKTVGCIIWLHEKAALEGGPGKNYWWVAPIRDTAKIAFRRLKLYLPNGTFKANENDRTITLRNGATIFFKGAEKPDSLYGEDVYAAVIDEATRVKEESWWAVRSTLTATGGPIRIIGNVKGRKNWAYKIARKAEARGGPEYHHAKLTVWDAVQGGIFPESEALDAKDILPERIFKELYLAEPGEDDEDFFNTDKISIVASWPSHAKLARGWDIATSEPKPGRDPDYTVGVKLAHADRMTYVLDVVRFRRAPDKVTAKIKTTAIADGRTCKQILEEEKGSAGKTMVQLFKQTLRGTGAGTVHGSPLSGDKIVRAYHFAADVNDGRVVMLDGDWNEEFLEELGDFPPVEGGHDDQVDAASHAYNHLAPNLKGRFRGWID